MISSGLLIYTFFYVAILTKRSGFFYIISLGGKVRPDLITRIVRQLLVKYCIEKIRIDTKIKSLDIIQALLLILTLLYTCKISAIKVG